MEVVRGVPIKEIFTVNNSWSNFVETFGPRIRSAVYKNVRKILCCKSLLGFAEYTCYSCGEIKRVFFTCKSRFCSACGKVQTDNWVDKYETNFLDIPYQHIVFTIPQLLWPLIQLNRKTGLDILFRAAQNTILLYTSSKLGYTPAIMTVVHTFGRDLKFNPHIHLLVSCGGLSKNKQRWLRNTYLHHLPLKELWRYQIVTELRESLAAGKTRFNQRILDKAYSSYKQWYVNVGKKITSAKNVVRYIGRYTKRPAIAQTRIHSLANGFVTFWFEDHKDKQKIHVTLPVLDFIGKLIVHIHDHYFRQIRYSGLLAPRSKADNLTRARFLIGEPHPQVPRKSSWRDRIRKFTGKDPLHCPNCKSVMCFSLLQLPPRGDPLVF